MLSTISIVLRSPFTNLVLVNRSRLTVPVVVSSVLLNYRKLLTTTIMANPIVEINEGQIKGKTLDDYLGNKFYGFLGIPYAQPPIGNLRFKAPVPAKPWQGIYDATKEGPACPSKHQLFFHLIGNEDNCLVLNVFTKELPNDDTYSNNLKPVMVWIHGGGFTYGSSELDIYGPEYLMTEDIVLVTINYRLGIFGFLSLKDPSLDVPGNAGLKDMVLALKWVQKNIENFGGDPKNVTIFGESAGSAAVHHLVLSPLTKGLFHKAIMQSGCALNCWGRGTINGQLAAELVDCKETDEAKILEYLKQLPAQKIVKGLHRSPDVFTADLIRPFGPVIEPYQNDNTFLSQEPLEIIKNGTYNHVPLIIGYNSKEGIFFDAVRRFIPKATITTDFETEISHLYNIPKGSEKSKEIAMKIKKFYFGDEEPTEKNLDKLYMLKGDTQFVYDIHRTIDGHKSTSQCPIYVYRMSIETSLNLYKTISLSKGTPLLVFINYLAYTCGNGMVRNLFLKAASTFQKNHDIKGVCHADDLSYLLRSFLTKKLTVGTIEELAVRRFVKLWTNFAKIANPTPVQNDVGDNDLLNVQWKPITKDDFHYLDIDEKLRLDKDPDVERMKSLSSIFNNDNN